MQSPPGVHFLSLLILSQLHQPLPEGISKASGHHLMVEIKVRDLCIPRPLHLSANPTSSHPRAIVMSL